MGYVSSQEGIWTWVALLKNRFCKTDTCSHHHLTPLVQPVYPSWWFQPIWKICSSNCIISPSIGVKIKKNLWKPSLRDSASYSLSTATLRKHKKTWYLSLQAYLISTSHQTSSSSETTNGIGHRHQWRVQGMGHTPNNLSVFEDLPPSWAMDHRINSRKIFFMPQQLV